MPTCSGEGMSTDSSIDRDSFQTFLANAFAVQESGLDSKSLSALLEIQRFICSRGFDLGQAMHMIAKHALGVSSASGIAIALLENDELVYRAGSGTAAKDVGLHFPAVLSVISDRQPRREILRVENASADTRIEAEICRQFEAMSLLMLPIYRDELLAGVMQVVSDQAHHFDDREVRSYRLMISALETGLSRQDASEQTSNAATAFEPISERRVNSLENVEAAEKAVCGGRLANGAESEPASERGPQPVSAFEQPGVRAWLTYRTMLPPRQTASWLALRKSIQKRTVQPWSRDLLHAVTAVGFALALGMAVWILQRDHSSISDVRLPSLMHEEHRDAAAQPSLAADVSSQAGHSTIDPPRLKRFRRVRIGPNEVDDIAEDVTIRYFETRPAEPKSLAGTKEVRFGRDVTVRYFSEVPVRVAQPTDTLETPPVEKTSFQSR